jgi:hypothetical protein
MIDYFLSFSQHFKIIYDLIIVAYKVLIFKTATEYHFQNFRVYIDKSPDYMFFIHLLRIPYL